MASPGTAHSASGQPLWTTLLSGAQLSKPGACRTLTLRAEAAARQEWTAHGDAVRLFSGALFDASANEMDYTWATEGLEQLLWREGWIREAITLAWYRGHRLRSDTLDRLP